MKQTARQAGATAMLLTVLFAPGRASAEDIVVGMSAAFRGPSSGLGIELYRGSKAYFEHVNSQGGFHGRTIAIKAYDDGYNPLPAIENTIRLIERDNVFVLFNYVGTPTVTRCLPLLRQHRDQSVFMFFPFTGAEPQRQPPYAEYVFNLRASYYQETGRLVEEFFKIGRTRIAVFYQIDAYGRNGWDGVRRALAKKGARMAAEATYKRGTKFDESLKPQVDVLRAAEPDAVISIGAYAARAAFVRDARNAGWTVPIANVSFVGSENMLALLLEAGKASGADYTQNLINSQVVPSYHDNNIPAVLEYRQMTERYKVTPPPEFADPAYQSPLHSFVSLEGFLNAKLLVAILKKMEPPFRRADVGRAAESVVDLDLGTGVPVSFGPGRHQASDEVYFTVVRDGQFMRLDDWTRWRK